MEIEQEYIKHESNLLESKNKFIFNYDNLTTNITKINFNIKVENSTSNYYFDDNKKYYTKIPPEDLQFFKDLVNQILNSDKTDYPDFKKIGKWVYNNIRYNSQLVIGKKCNIKEILNNKQGVCAHITKLYNTLLTAYGIDTIEVSGFAKDITENNRNVRKIENENNQIEGKSEYIMNGL